MNQIGISAAGKYYGYVVVNISTTNILTFMVLLGNASFHTYYSTYDDLQVAANIGDGIGAITSATTCPTTLAVASLATHV